MTEKANVNQPTSDQLRAWRLWPPRCPHCHSEDTWLFGLYYGDPVWACDSPQCPNVQNQHFFDLSDIERLKDKSS